MIVHIEPVRAVIQWNRMLLFTGTKDVDNIASLSPMLREYLSQAPTANQTGAALPFEFRALEALLIYVCETYEQQVQEVSPQIEAGMVPLL